ncbi:MAG: DUF2059 domain-containing protein [Blastocatellia bacterium]
MFKVKFCVAALFALLLFGATAFAQESKGGIPAGPDEKTLAAARHLLELTGVSKLGQQIWPTMFDALKRSQPAIPESAWDEIDNEFRAFFSSNEFLDPIAGVYARHFSEDELKQLTAFYETPLGKKMVSSLPDITRECMSIGGSIGRDVMQRAMERLKQKGYKPVTD